MPDTDERLSDRRTGPFREYAEYVNRQIARLGVDPVPLPVEYCPYITYRGRILWHHLSDAHDVASGQARARGVRHVVTPVRVHGQDHLMWWVHSARGHMKFAKGNDPEWIED